MERYGKFFGCDAAGRYEALRAANGLSQFLIRCGAKNAGAAMDAVTQTVCRFDRFEEYYKSSPDDYPVSLCYVPMHLYKKEAFREMTEPVYAIAVNGLENKARDTKYACCAVTSARELLESEEFNYLDQIFGTPLVSWKDMYRLREEKQELDYTMTPAKVNPVLKQADINAVCSVVDAIYAGKKHIVICIESGYSFNRRSLDFLQQVYSLLPPRLAVETGFVTYQPKATAEYLAETAGVRIQVVPAEAVTLLPEADENTVVLNLNNPAGIKPDTRSRVFRCAMWWARLTWDQRREAMKALFADKAISLLDAQKYVEITAAFSENDFLNGRMKDLRFTDIDSIRKVYENDPVLSKNIGWITAQFCVFVAKRLGEGTTLRSLKGQALANAKIAELRGDRALALTYNDQYQFVSKLEAEDSAKAAIRFAEAGIRQIAEEKAQAKIDTAQRNLEAEKQARAADAQAHAQAMADEKVKQEAAVRELEARHTTEKTALEQKIQEQNAAHEQTIQANAAAHAQEKQAMATAHAQALADEKVKQEAAMRELEARAVHAINELKTRHATEKMDLEQKLTAEQTGRNEDAARARQQIAAAQEQLATVQSRVDAEKEQLRQELQAERDAAIRQLKAEFSVEKRQMNMKFRQELAIEQKKTEDALRNVDALLDEPEQPGRIHDGDEPGRRNERGQNSNSGSTSLMPVIIGALVGLVVGVILTVIVVFAMGGFGGGAETTVPTEPNVTTTAPVETTPPPETTLPPETTAPTETTAPSEPTMPEPSDPQDLDWTEVTEQLKLTGAETNPETIATLLSGYELGADVTVEAVVTVAENGFDGENGFALPETFALLLRKAASEADAETTETEETTQPSEPETGADLVMEGTTFRLVVMGGEAMQKAAIGLFARVNPVEDTQTSLTVATANGDLTLPGALMAQVIDADCWWQQVTGVSTEESDMLEAKTKRNSNRVPVAVVACANETVYIYDYSDDPEMGDVYVGKQTEEGECATRTEGLVAVGVKTQ